MKRKQWLLIVVLVVGSFSSCVSANTLSNQPADTTKVGKEIQGAAVPVTETEWIYYIEGDTNKLMRLNRTTNKKEKILTNVSYYHLCGDKLFYTPCIDWDVPNVKGVDASIGSLYVSDLDGKNPQLIAGKDKPVMPVNKLEVGEYIAYTPTTVEGDWLYFIMAYGVIAGDGCSYSMYRYHLNDGKTELLFKSNTPLDQYYIGHDKMIIDNISSHFSVGNMIMIDLTTKNERILSKETGYLGCINDKLYYVTSESNSLPFNDCYNMDLYELDLATDKHTQLTKDIPWHDYHSLGLLKNDIAYCITSLDNDRSTVLTYNLTTKERHEETMDTKKVDEEILESTTFHIGQETYQFLPTQDFSYGYDVYQILKDGSKSQLLHEVRCVKWVTDTK